MTESQAWRVNLVSHTHWDRAWYVTFQEYRMRLVRLIDRLIEILNHDPNFTCYMLDGQMSVLDDYLEVRPQNKPLLQALTRSGRVTVGPWFVLADEFLVSGEALIRNLMLGHRIGEDYGGVMKIGYVPDGFGHIAQLPQILRGFGIDNAFFWRGMGAEGDTLGTEFMWQAPDGSSVTTILMPWGYHTASNLGFGVHWGDTSQMQFDMNLAQEKLDKFVAKLTPMTHTDAILLMNGIDHQEAQPEVPMVLAQANARWTNQHVEQSTLTQHLAMVREYVASHGIALPCFQGEFRWGRYSEILQGVHATRLHLKQRNYQVETLLERVVEPLISMAWLAGAAKDEQQDATDDLLWTAWRWLLLNHPHDDIYGSGIDAVHDEMTHRFSQAEQIGTLLARDNLRALARHVDFSKQVGVPVIFVNPLNWQRDEMVEVTIDFDYDDPTADAFELVTGAGDLVPHQVVSDQQTFWMETLKANRKRQVRVVVSVSVPACGYTTLYARSNLHPPTPALRSGEGENSQISEWQVGERGAENRYLSFQIEDDGGLTVTHKATGSTYRDLNHFEDVADTGDEYTFCPLVGDVPITTRGKSAVVRRRLHGDNAVRFEITHMLRLPKSLAEDRQSRQGVAGLVVTSEVVLYRDSPYLLVKTTFNNTVNDHKLSVVFPTDMTPKVAHVDEAFTVVERQIELPASEGWVEDPTPLMHQRSFTDLSDGTRGLAVLNRGLAAVEVTRTKEGGTRIAIPLVRAVGWLSRDDLWVRRIAAGPLVPTPGAQCHGENTFQYAILPHMGDWQQVYPQAYNYTVPITAARGDTHAGIDLHDMNITRDDPTKITYIPFPRGGDLPDANSFVSVNGEGIVLSALRRGKGGLVVRFYNLRATPTSARISAFKPIAEAHRLNMNEETQETLTVKDGRVDVAVSGGQIVTVGLGFA